MLPSKQKKLAAVVAGVALVGATAIAVNHWSNQYVERQGRDEVALSARRSIALAERRLNQVIDALADLAQRGVASCSPSHLEAMRQTALTITPIKELAILGADGATMCTDLEVAASKREVVSSPNATSVPGVVIEVVRLAERSERMLRVRSVTFDGQSALAALIPGDMLVPQISPYLTPIKTYARLTTRDGTLIGEAGPAGDDNEVSGDRIVAHLQSDLFGLVVTTSISRASLVASFSEFSFLGIAGGAIALALAFAAIAIRRGGKDPISQIERALAANEFVPYYQPILDITNGRLAGAEVLIRWRKPDGSIVPPGSFIPLVESTGLIFDLTRALMRSVCEEVGAKIAERPHLKISFNLTARHFVDDSTITDIRDIFSSSPLPLSQVVLEVTERQPLTNLNGARRVIAGLQELGARVAIDDVGTGHGGLSYLLKLGVDIIKIDKLFVDAIGAERYSTTIIKSLVELATSMRMEIVAEGVENFDQVAYLRDHGIRFAQGYVFAPPLPGPAFLQLIEATDPLPGWRGEQAEPETEGLALTHFTSARTRIAAA